MLQNTKATTCVLFDVRAMQSFNDARGWEAGNGLLEAIAAVLTTCFPAPNKVMRLSGDEFLVVSGEMVAERSSKLAQDASLRIKNALGVSVTFGIGSGVLEAEAKRSATVALFECRALQR